MTSADVPVGSFAMNQYTGVTTAKKTAFIPKM